MHGEQERNLRRLTTTAVLAGSLLLGALCWWLYDGAGYPWDEMSNSPAIGPRHGQRLPLPPDSRPWTPAGSLAVPAPAAEGARLYANFCQFCHGADGRGNTPVGQEYLPRPPLLAAVVASTSPAALADAVENGIASPEIDTRPPLGARWHAFALYLSPEQCRAVEDWVRTHFQPGGGHVLPPA